MRTRASIVAVTGALAVAGLVAPTAVAVDGPGRDSAPRFAEKFDTSGKSGATARSAKAAAPVISSVVVNGGKPIVVGVSNKPVRATFKVTSPTGIGFSDAELWHGTTYTETTPFIPTDGIKNCTGTTATCTADFEIMPFLDLTNARAGKWNLAVGVIDGEFLEETAQVKAGSLTILRESRLTTNATPEPVKKNKILTVTGALRIANWSNQTFGGYGNHTVHLEYMKKGAKKYTRVKTLKTDKAGNVKTTIKATADGYWRYVYPGVSPVIAPKTSVADFVDVR
ncbi:calcium-binding protein [Streptomyces qinzhouensis]|uniref:Calcium-binding protein n=1 Tax=Streptomyces qinzhouensis TaxID=2599401 RepID=A0A5B8JC22_9ACTN|nr:calcium-binding protein [Streptomyces qinzhouensis]QDY77451.1 calcium-binding protein [Streptomyces qinzhouensis]